MSVLGCLPPFFSYGMGKTPLFCLTDRSHVSFTHTEPPPHDTLSNRRSICWNRFCKERERGERGSNVRKLPAVCLWALGRGDTVALCSHGYAGHSCYTGSHLNNRIYRTILNDGCPVRQQTVNMHTITCSFPESDLSFPKIGELS